MKKVAFLTGTRADFGKIKSLIRALEAHPESFEVEIYVTGMHLNPDYGNTHIEVENAFADQKISLFTNHDESDSMDLVLAKTVSGLSGIVRRSRPDLLIVHGDRVEALAGAIVGSLNNILVGHIEGGEVSGTIDELLRHAITKLSHLHFVSNDKAYKNVIQLGELRESVYIIGSPDIDIMNSNSLPTLDEVRAHYEIPFEEYAVLMFHPVTTDLERVRRDTVELCEFVRTSQENYVIIGPNNDSGSDFIVEHFAMLRTLPNVRFYPSLRFEHFLTLLKNSRFIIGNSSAGIREAPHFGVPCVNIGYRQHNRASGPLIVDVAEPDQQSLVAAVASVESINRYPISIFGDGESSIKFQRILASESVWETPVQKLFVSLAPNEQ
jgi:UDP-N-acetylglucosamine 2-epimerase (hydrolysing)